MSEIPSSARPLSSYHLDMLKSIRLALKSPDVHNVGHVSKAYDKLLALDAAIEHFEHCGLTAALQRQLLKCRTCDRAATCIGQYEGHGGYAPSCDSCCGHGNEDGWCRPVAEAIAEMSRWILESEEREARHAQDSEQTQTDSPAGGIGAQA